MTTLEERHAAEIEAAQDEHTLAILGGLIPSCPTCKTPKAVEAPHASPYVRRQGVPVHHWHCNTCNGVFVMPRRKGAA